MTDTVHSTLDDFQFIIESPQRHQVRKKRRSCDNCRLKQIICDQPGAKCISCETTDILQTLLKFNVVFIVDDPPSMQGSRRSEPSMQGSRRSEGIAGPGAASTCVPRSPFQAPQQFRELSDDIISDGVLGTPGTVPVTLTASPVPRAAYLAIDGGGHGGQVDFSWPDLIYHPICTTGAGNWRSTPSRDSQSREGFGQEYWREGKHIVGSRNVEQELFGDVKDPSKQCTATDFEKYDDIPVSTGAGVPGPIPWFDPFIALDTTPAPVRKYSIPIGSTNRDLMDCTQTGADKTAGSFFPILSPSFVTGPSESHATYPHARKAPKGPMTDAHLLDTSLRDVFSWVYSALTSASLCVTQPAVIQLYLWSSLIGLARATPVDTSPHTPAREHKTCDIVLPVLLFLFVAFLVAAWWVRRRHATRRQGTPATCTPPRPVSVPDPVYLPLTRSEALSTTSHAPEAILHMANALTATPIRTERPRQKWTSPEIVLAGLSVLLTFVALILGGLSLLYAQRAVSHA